MKDAWVDTVADDVLETIQAAPDETIVPAELRESGGSRALALLRELASATATTSLHLKSGEVIGQGGMGVVRAAEQVALGRVVAVKTLKPERRRDASSALDLLREAWVTGTVEHPNVVPVHYLGAEPDGTPLIVMKRIEGVEWSKLIHATDEVQRRFGASDLLAWNLGILLRVLDALRFAHHRGIVHRDLKPANVMIGDFGEVYLLDWGIAVSLRDDASGRLPFVENATDLAGTPCYMAPEMLGRESGPRISERTDVYLAGAVLFEIISGRPPHVGATALEVLASVIESKPVVPAHVPPELARIVQCALHGDPAERFESVETLRGALQGYLEHRGSAELTRRALERTDEMLAALAKGGVEREEISRMFGACRFGFHEALVVWRDNAEARAGLARATIAVAEYELAAGNPGTAVALLGDLDEPPPLLARAKAALAERSQRDAVADRLLAANNPVPGRRTRTYIAASIGPFFTFVPLSMWIDPGLFPFTHLSHGLFAAGACVVVSLVVWWAWDTLSSTLLNRRVSAAAIFMFAAESVLSFGMWTADATVVEAQLAVQFMWGTCVAWLAIALDPWFTPGAAAYFASFLVASRWPEHQMLATACANFTFVMNMILRWRPESWRMSVDERVWRDARARKRRSRRES